jgi:hypothetical protein
VDKEEKVDKKNCLVLLHARDYIEALRNILFGFCFCLYSYMQKLWAQKRFARLVE